MLRKEREAVPVGNDPVPQQKGFGPGQPTRVDVYRNIEEIWDRRRDEIMRLLKQPLTSLEQDARQPRLTMEADGPANTKTRERTEGVTTAIQAMHGDSCSVTRVHPGPKTNSDQFRRGGRTSRSPLQGRSRGRERRCGTQIVSPIIGEALPNSRW